MSGHVTESVLGFHALFLFSISISFYSSVLRWWPVRTMVGLDLFLILSNYENAQWLLIPWRMEFWFLKGPHIPGHRLSESVISLVLPALAPRTSCFWCLPTALSPEALCTVSFPGMFPPPLTPGSPQWPTSSFHSTIVERPPAQGGLYKHRIENPIPYPPFTSPHLHYSRVIYSLLGMLAPCRKRWLWSELCVSTKLIMLKS